MMSLIGMFSIFQGFLNKEKPGFILGKYLDQYIFLHDLKRLSRIPSLTEENMEPGNAFWYISYIWRKTKYDVYSNDAYRILSDSDIKQLFDTFVRFLEPEEIENTFLQHVANFARPMGHGIDIGSFKNFVEKSQILIMVMESMLKDKKNSQSKSLEIEKDQSLPENSSPVAPHVP